MKLDLTARQKLKISQKLAPAQQQKLKILAMDTQELLQFLESEQLENPILEFDSYSAAGQEYTSLGEWMGYSASADPEESGIRESGEYCPEIPAEEHPLLSDHLLSQIEHLRVPPELLIRVKALLPYMDGTTGYFQESRGYLQAVLSCSDGEFEEAAGLIRNMEPAGVGAFDLADCLALQLKRKGEYDETLGQILSEHLEDLAGGKLSHITRTLGISTEKARNYLRMIRNLDPKPAKCFGRQAVSYIIPDLRAVKEEGRWEITVRDGGQRRIHLNPTYMQIAGSAREEALQNYFKEKIGRAEAVIRAVEQREETLIRIAGFALSRQECFALRHGQRIRLTMRQAAEELGLHPSTVSRAVQGKYIDLPTGVCALRELFPGSNEKAEAGKGQELSKEEQMIALLESLIHGEDRSRPLSDMQLSDLLSEKGFTAARRTVAKYREIAGIPSAARRKGIAFLNSSGKN